VVNDPGAARESDIELVRRALADRDSDASRRAASQLFERYQEAVYIWCNRYARDHDRAMDLAQDVLLRAYRSLEGFQGRAHFGSWLFAIARNRCITEMQRLPMQRDEEVDPDDIAGEGLDPESDFLRAQDERTLLAMIRDHLTPVEQEAIWMRCVERMPLPAITRTLSIEQRSGARGVLQQARRKLKAAMKGEG
jgi:RNA polymerase sigma-70 factor, ECF subfamily